jgi:hypothetical protein
LGPHARREERQREEKQSEEKQSEEKQSEEKQSEQKGHGRRTPVKFRSTTRRRERSLPKAHTPSNAQVQNWSARRSGESR